MGHSNPGLAEPFGSALDNTFVYPCIAELVSFLVPKVLYLLLCVIAAMIAILESTLLIVVLISVPILTFPGFITILWI